MEKSVLKYGKAVIQIWKIVAEKKVGKILLNIWKNKKSVLVLQYNHNFSRLIISKYS